jgi:methionyl-tRNA synthetase
VSTASRPAIIVPATPTSNGDLHVGHLAGPYLAADIYARYLRATGRPVVNTTCTDDSQSYVITTAHRLGLPMQVLVDKSTNEIEHTYQAMGGILGDLNRGLPPVDHTYRETVRRFVTELHAAGKFELRTLSMPYATRARTFLYDGLVSGVCPACYANSAGGVCEGCGHPNNFDELLDPRSTLDPEDPVEMRATTILVLPLERYRERLTAYYAEHAAVWRPHPKQLIDELLAGPLPDFPVTVPGTWGVAAPFAETPGQIIYPWIEAMPAAIYGTWWSLGATGEVDAPWRAETDAELIYFHGFDNVCHWGVLDLVLLMAHDGKYVLPSANVVNEFYELDGEKFSTSRGHLVWGADLLAEAPRDLVRCYLALTGPEFQRTNFNRDTMARVMTVRLVEPWNELARTVADAVAGRPEGAALPTTERGRGRAHAVIERVKLCFRPEHLSLGRAAETILTQVDRLRTASAHLDGDAALGDLLLELRTLLACASPFLVDTTNGVDADLDAELPNEIVPFDFPALHTFSDHAASTREEAQP